MQAFPGSFLFYSKNLAKSHRIFSPEFFHPETAEKIKYFPSFPTQMLYSKNIAAIFTLLFTLFKNSN